MTNIQWTDAVWNCVVGCSRVSPGCGGADGGGCYAERMAHRLGSNPKTPHYAGLTRMTEGGPRWTGEVRVIPEKLDEPLRWRRPRRVFVNSMSDLFHEKLTDEQIAAIFGVMAAAPQHTFQVLTKRPEPMRAWFEWIAGQDPGPTMHVALAPYLGSLEPAGYTDDAASAIVIRNEEACMRLCELDEWPLPNVWIGVSIEDQKTADERIPILLETPAAVRFVSAEPLLGLVDLRVARGLPPEDRGILTPDAVLCDDLLCRRDGPHYPREFGCRWSGVAVYGGAPGALDWIIVGGESGPRARPCDVDWIRSILRQCREAGTACFVKQLGSQPKSDHRTRPPGEDWIWPRMIRDRKGADPQEWPEDLRAREFPVVSHERARARA